MTRRMFYALASGLMLALGAAAASAQTVSGSPDAAQLASAGQSALEKGQFQAAAEHFGRALRGEGLSDAEVAKLLYLRGVAQEGAGRPAQAIADITSALYLPGLSSEDRAKAYLSRGRAFEAVGMSDLASSDIAKAKSGGVDERAVARASRPAASASSSSNSGAPAFATSSENSGGGSGAPRFETSSETAPPPVPSFETVTETTPRATSGSRRQAAFETRSEEPIPQFRTTIAPQESAPALPPAQTRTAARSPPAAAPQGWSTAASSEQQPVPAPAPQEEESGSTVKRFFGNMWAKATGGDDEKNAAVAAPETTPAASGAPQWNQTTSAARAQAPSWSSQSAPAAQSAPGWTSASSSPSQAVPAAAPAAQPAPAGGNGYRIQLAALRSSEEAEATWKRLKARHASLLNGHEPNIVKTELGALGTFYRVQLGPFADKGSSQQLCNTFKAGGLDCFLLAP